MLDLTGAHWSLNAIEKRIAALESRFMPPEPTTIKVVYTVVDRHGVERVIGPAFTDEPDADHEIHVRFVTAPDDPESYPQDSCEPHSPVDKSEPAIVVALEPGDDLESVARELGITAVELHRQIQSGIVKIIYPTENPP